MNTARPQPSATVRHFLARLENVRADGTGHNAKCPAHDDSKNSLHVAQGEDGRVLLTCHAGCPLERIVHAAGAAMSDLFPKNGSGPQDGTRGQGRPSAPSKFGAVTAAYDYVDENGALNYQVVRDTEKNFRQRRPTHAEPPADLWTYNLEGTRKLLYRLPDVLQTVAYQIAGKFPQPLFIVEGEKDADALTALGLVSTTNSGGAGKWSEEHTKQIAGATQVVVLPDNDEPGRRHARVVAAALRATKTTKVKIIALPNLPEKGDVSDWLAAQPADTNTRDALLAIAAAPVIPSGWISARALMDSDIPDADWITPGLLTANSNCVLSGESGVWKSWVAWDWAIALALGGVLFEREEFTCKKSRVMIVSADEPIASTRRKLKFLTAHAYPSVNGTGDLLASDLLVHGGDLELSDQEELGRVIDAVAGFMPDVIFIDSMDATIEGDENKREFVRNARHIARSIRDAHPCSIVFIHHWGKQSKDRPNTPAARLRGFSGIRGFVSHHLCIERAKEGYATFIVDKNRDQEEHAPFTLMPHIYDKNGIAHFEYAGDAIETRGETSVQLEVLDLLKKKGGPMRQSDICAALKKKHNDQTVKSAIRMLVTSRPPRAERGEVIDRSPVISLIDSPGTPTGRLDEPAPEQPGRYGHDDD